MKTIHRYVFPDNKCMEEKLYYRVNHGYIENDYDNGIKLEKNSEVSFDTYLNSYSAKKWYQYTGIDEIYLQMKGLGNLNVCIKEHLLHGKIITGKVVHSERVDLEHNCIVGPIKATRGVLSVDIAAIDDVKISSIEWCTDCEISQKVSPAVIFCTYKREKEILRNLKLISEILCANILDEFCDGIHVYVIDNGQSLTYDNNTNISIIANPNCGGSGGFARGLYEALNSGRNHSHYLLMDDDVEISECSIRKTMCLLSFIKEEYRDYVIGGQMLNLPDKNIQHENGAYYDYKSKSLLKNDRVILNHNGLDLTMAEHVFRNDLEVKKNNVPAWFYCCIPKEHIRNDNLPLPLFINMDDVEFSIRNHFKIITFNGIFVWHPQYKGKASILTQCYYAVRNRNYTIIYNTKYSPLYVLCWNGKLVFNFIKGVIKKNYETFIYTKAAYEYILAGPDYIREINLASFHTENKKRLEAEVQSVENCFGHQFRELRRMLRKMNKEYKKVYRAYNENGLCLRDKEFWKKQWGI